MMFFASRERNIGRSPTARRGRYDLLRIAYGRDNRPLSRASKVPEVKYNLQHVQFDVKYTNVISIPAGRLQYNHDIGRQAKDYCPTPEVGSYETPTEGFASKKRAWEQESTPRPSGSTGVVVGLCSRKVRAQTVASCVWSAADGMGLGKHDHMSRTFTGSILWETEIPG